MNCGKKFTKPTKKPYLLTVTMAIILIYLCLSKKFSWQIEFKTINMIHLFYLKLFVSYFWFKCISLYLIQKCTLDKWNLTVTQKPCEATQFRPDQTACETSHDFKFPPQARKWPCLLAKHGWQARPVISTDKNWHLWDDIAKLSRAYQTRPDRHSLSPA